MKIGELLREYLEEEDAPLVNSDALFLKTSIEAPVVPYKNEWDTLKDPQRLVRRFKFDSQKVLKFFIDEILEHQEESRHHAQILIEYGSVTIEIYTHDINDITEIDIEWSKSADQIYKDVFDYGG